MCNGYCMKNVEGWKDKVSRMGRGARLYGISGDHYLCLSRPLASTCVLHLQLLSRWVEFQIRTQGDWKRDSGRSQEGHGDVRESIVIVLVNI